MERKDWLALCAVHSDAWLISLAFFYAARFDADGRAELFSLLNQHPSVYEVVTGRVARNKMYKKKAPKVQAAAAAPAPVAVYEPEPNPFVRPGYQAADQVRGWAALAGLACRGERLLHCLSRVHAGLLAAALGAPLAPPLIPPPPPLPPAAAAAAHGPAADR